MKYCLETPIATKKVRKGVFAYKYSSGVIDIENERFVLHSMTDAIKAWRKKYPLFLIFLLAATIARSQIYGGVTLPCGYAQTTQTVYNYNTHANEQVTKSTLFFQMPAGYYINNLRVRNKTLSNIRLESGFIYSPALYVPLMAGYTLGDHVSMTGLAGVMDQLTVTRHPIQVTQHFPWAAACRFRAGIFYLSVEYCDRTTFIGLGMISR